MPSLITKAILYWRSGRPIPLDLEVEMIAAGKHGMYVAGEE